MNVMEVTTYCPPQPVREFVNRYAHGECLTFAAALARILDVAEVVMCYSGDKYVHAALPWDGQLLDSYGKTTLAAIRKRYADEGIKALVMPLAEVERRMQ